MKVEEFYNIFCNELKLNKSLYPYYKLTHGSVSDQLFRKAYFIQRLHFIENHIPKDDSLKILDCGCGYGTTAIYFSMNNIPVLGTTLEEKYYEVKENRKEFWNNYGDANLYNCVYQNIFDNPPKENSLDYIILQDTLHHIEPVDKGLEIFYKSLKQNGKIILVEENGACIVQSIKLWKQRGNKRIKECYDNVLGKTYLMGDENIRSRKKWKKLFKEAGFIYCKEDTQYIRFYPPCMFKTQNFDKRINQEQNFWKKVPLVKNLFFFGLNMVFEKK